MNLNLLNKDLKGKETINEETKTVSYKVSLTNLSLSRTHFHDKSVSILNSRSEKEKVGVQNENIFKKKDRNGINSKICSRGHWRPTEDAKLKELVAQFGPQNWNLIAHHLLGRSGKSCRLRWFNQLDPRINKKAFTEEEEVKLLSAHRAYGNKWALISRLFPGRTDNAVKNHWHVIMARRTRESQRKSQQHQDHSPVDAEITVSSSCHYNEAEGSFVNEYDVDDDDDDDDDDGSAVSTCTTELSLTPPSLLHQTRVFNYDNALPSGEDGQCMQIAAIKGKYGKKKLDHQNQETITVNDIEKMKMKINNEFYFFDFLGVGFC